MVKLVIIYMSLLSKWQLCHGLPMVIPQETAASDHPSQATPRESRGSPWIPTSVGEMDQSGKVNSSSNNSNNNSIY